MEVVFQPSICDLPCSLFSVALLVLTAFIFRVALYCTGFYIMELPPLVHEIEYFLFNFSFEIKGGDSLGTPLSQFFRFSRPVDLFLSLVDINITLLFFSHSMWACCSLDKVQDDTQIIFLRKWERIITCIMSYINKGVFQQTCPISNQNRITHDGLKYLLLGHNTLRLKLKASFIKN